MSGLQVLGVAMVAAVLLGFVIVTMWVAGPRVSLVIWSSSIVVTAVVYVGALLAAGELR